MAIGINEIIVLILYFLVFGVFLLFDLFKRNEKWGFFAYIVAVLPVNYLWILGIDLLLVYIVLFGLWIVCMFRDLLGMKSDNKDFDDVVLFLLLGIVVQLILTAILPSDQINPELQANTVKLLYFYVPDIHNPAIPGTFLMAFKGTATALVFFAIIPLIVSIKDEEIPFIGIIIIVAIFIGPFIYLGYIWLPESIPVLTGLFAVILIIILLIITNSGRE